jgi:RNA polymerase sigma-70 factor (ECF subfamily)
MRVGSSPAPAARAALEALCNAYWYPIYALIRRKGNRHDEALDLTQAYFARLLEKSIIAAANQERGRFRAFLKTDCQHFLIDQYRRRTHNGQPPVLSIAGADAESRYGIEPAHNITPERQFDRSWAVTLLERALRQVAMDYSSKGQTAVFDRLKHVLVQDAEAVPVPALATALGMTEGAVYTAVHRLKQRYRAALLREVTATLDEGASAEDEIRSLFEAFRR